MTEQEEKQTSIEDLIKKLYQLERDLIEIEKHREESIKLAYEKGFDEGVKHINQLIMSDERFPF
jgi:predicted  nucleic acid-binding Zn-ribbon protein